MQPISFKISCNTDVMLSHTFIDKYMHICTPVYALIYIYGLRHSTTRGDISVQKIADIFNILETDVINAWKYWEEQGLVKMSTLEDNESVIEFLPATALQENKPEAKGETKKDDALYDEFLQNKTFNVSLRPQYTVEELSFYRKQSKEMAQLFGHTEQTLGKMLTYHDLNVIFGFYDWLRLPVDVIMYLLTYCAKGGHNDLRYVEKVAIDWAERDLKTVDDAENYTKTFDRDFKAIMAALGHPSAFPSATQRKYMDKWLNEMAMSIELIAEACDRCAVQIGKPKLTYVDKILADWHKRSVKSLKDIEVADANWQESKKISVVNSVAKVNKNRNKFANFKPRERDYDHIERMEQEYLIKSVEG